MRLRVTKFGDSAEGIALTGNPKSGEPDHVRITFPSGDVEVVRAKDGPNPDYWVHIRVNKEGCGMVSLEDMKGAIVGARLDIAGRNTSEVDVGDFDDPKLYHLAVRVKPDWEGGK